MLQKNNYPSFILLLAAFLIGGWLSYSYFSAKSRPVEEASVLLEKIKSVAKLTTVEGQFTEVYNYSAYSGYFTFFWDKKVLVRVKATVAAGYDLENLHFKADSSAKVLYMSQLASPEILSIDHDLDYYDISEGLFESFAPEDYNRINQRAKDLIRDQAIKSNLLVAAQEQGNKMLDLIQFMAKNAGWQLVISDNPSLFQQ